MSPDERLKIMNTRRQQAWSEAQRLLDDVGREHRDLSAEEQAQWQRMNGDIDALDAEIEDLTFKTERQKESEQIRAAEGISFGSSGYKDTSDELRRFLRGEGPHSLTVPVHRAAHERCLMRDGATAMEARALAWDTGSIASAVPTSMARALYESMEASSAVLRMPTRKVVTDSGETMLFPTLASHSIATQVSGQGTVLAGTDPVFANFELGAFKYGELVIVANEVVTDTSFDIAAFIGSDLGRAIGRKIGTDLVLGSGSGQPTGVATAATSAGSVTTGGSLIGPTYETLVDTRYAVNDEYRASKSAAWLFKDATTAAIRKLRDGAGGTVGTPLWSPSMIAGAPDMLLGSPVYIDHNVASMASNARIGYFADWNSFYVRQVGDVVIEVDRSRYFDTDQLGVRGKWRVDGNLADSDALVSMLQNV